MVSIVVLVVALDALLLALGFAVEHSRTRKASSMLAAIVMLGLAVVALGAVTLA